MTRYYNGKEFKYDEPYSVLEMEELYEKEKTFTNPNNHHYDSQEFWIDYIWWWMRRINLFSKWGEGVINREVSTVANVRWELLVGAVEFLAAKGHNISVRNKNVLGIKTAPYIYYKLRKGLF